ncbi:MAG: dihydropteroate synthase [Neisseriaceae bacterium]|nr:dihydropteroate synthase [Neisseriaceae bacterium]MBP6863185.1 dihydropteroate synthase [Neisseriaceae bacterium]
MQTLLKCGRFDLDLSSPQVMGILNATPDSFSDGGRYADPAAVLAVAEQMVADGVGLLDIGGESTRPNAPAVSPAEEIDRVMPVLEAVQALNVPVSLDTRRTEVMQVALAAGYVDLINDISALEDKGAVALMSAHPDTAICLMHMQGQPQNMQQQPDYRDVVAEVSTYLKARVQACLDAGIALERLLVDPGFGFGKTLEHNVDLMVGLQDWLLQVDVPVLIGVSRKTMLGQMVGEPVASERRGASVAAALAAVSRGAHIIRVHDVKDTVQAIRVWQNVGIFLR